MDEEQRRREAGGEDGGGRGEAEACMISLLILMNT